MIDLHVHSIFSDGSLTPEQLVQQASELGLTAIGLTDHDCTDGVARLLEACDRTAGVAGVSGVEISADVAKGTLHMLGYFVDPENARLRSVLEEIRDGRGLRNRRILDKLNALGLELTWREVAEFAGGDVVGRPHFAQALMARRHVTSKDAAFNLYLAKGKAAYVDRFRLSPEQSVAVILEAGGVPVLSHPSTLLLDRQGLRGYVEELRSYGLQGIEAYYSEHSDQQREEYLGLARDLDLVATGGSDFHGEVNPSVRLGRGFGSLAVPDSVMEALSAARERGGVPARG